MAQPKKPSEGLPAPDGKEAEKRKAVERVRSSLESLRAHIGKETKPRALEDVRNALKTAKDSHAGDGSRKWIELQKGLKDELEAQDVPALEKALKEGKEVELDLGHLADELGATEEYLKLQEANDKPQADKIWDKADKAVREKGGKAIEKLKNWGISVEDIRNWIVALIAGILEGFPIGSMSKIAGSLRFKIAMNEATKDKRLDNEDRKKILNPEKPFELKGHQWTLEELWTSRYEEWLSRKRAATGAFKEAPPSIREVLHPPVEGPSVTQAPKDKLFGIDGLKQGGSIEVASGVPQTIQVNNDKIEINRLDDRAQITINGTKKFKINHSLKGITLQAPSANAGDVILNAKVESNDVISSSLTAILTSAQPDKDFTVETGGKRLNFQKIT